MPQQKLSHNQTSAPNFCILFQNILYVSCTVVVHDRRTAAYIVALEQSRAQSVRRLIEESNKSLNPPLWQALSVFGPSPVPGCSLLTSPVLAVSRAIKFALPSLDTQPAEEQRTHVHRAQATGRVGVACCTRSSTATPLSLDFSAIATESGAPYNPGALLPPRTRLRRNGRRGCRRRPSRRCVRGGLLHRSGRLRRRYVRARRPRRHRLIRCVRAFVTGPRQSGLRRLRRVDRTGVGCGGILGPGLLGGAALLPGLLEVADGVRVQCELLVFRTSESLEPRQELIGSGKRPASETMVVSNTMEPREARCTDLGRLYRSGAGNLLAFFAGFTFCIRLATARACAFPRASPQERRRGSHAGWSG